MVGGEPLLLFRLDPVSGVPAYRQLVDQVDRAIRLGHLAPGDRLPSVREVVEQVTINPNTVHRAYRELEHLGLVEGRHGSGTFVADRVVPTADDGARERLLGEAVAWIGRARAAGLERADVDALLAAAVDRFGDGDGNGAGRMEGDGRVNSAGRVTSAVRVEEGTVEPDRAGNAAAEAAGTAEAAGAANAAGGRRARR